MGPLTTPLPACSPFRRVSPQHGSLILSQCLLCHQELSYHESKTVSSRACLAAALNTQLNRTATQTQDQHEAAQRGTSRSRAGRPAQATTPSGLSRETPKPDFQYNNYFKRIRCHMGRPGRGVLPCMVGTLLAFSEGAPLL